MTSIGLSELISKLKTELLQVTPEKDGKLPFLFVDSVELELQVTVSKGTEGGINIDVVGIGGAELGGDLSKEHVQTVKVTFSSLFDKQQLVDLYKTTHPNDVLPALHQNMKAAIKGDNQGSANDEVV